MYLTVLPVLVLTLLLVHQSVSQDHTNNWAVIVSTSKYWFNYRHNSDALTIYHLVKKQGIPDSNIILMVPEDVACTPKNVIPGTVYNTANTYPIGQRDQYNRRDYDVSPDPHNLYDEENIEIDYKGDDVTVESLLRLLTGRHHPGTPRNKRLLSNQHSNLFIYLSGHGGDQFLKFRDSEILTAQDLTASIQELYVQQRFSKAFLIVETCQAATMADFITTPGVITSTSSAKGENSYSHGHDTTIGSSIVDKYTFYLHQFYQRTNGWAKTSVGQFLQSFPYQQLRSSHVYRTELFENDEMTGEKRLDVFKTPILDFFGATQDKIEFTLRSHVLWGQSDDILARNGTKQAENVHTASLQAKKQLETACIQRKTAFKAVYKQTLDQIRLDLSDRLTASNQITWKTISDWVESLIHSYSIQWHMLSLQITAMMR